ncbi:GMC family oxidoreductase N-terminal domain-containing protein [Texcoconibacillus texcoconensis]|uniref:Choline dehydrogenase-like flavoprotein n=1 Tax=Texcoconibacillus texcoconensis TaxID=1095777 RepID=A0A840QMH8_9BACI|nr:GMC family oxidoreductase N-terminal domain-containing protein [Texcoconibacillus texcoconensis]MBB5172584.1 choline dehydrogenase-like flavoprotein [Texcoconibacillus texcoconensis]
MPNPDVIVIGAGGGGPVIAKELGELGLKVTVLEAGPWYGNKQWPMPNKDRGSLSSSNVDDLDIGLYRAQFNKYENDMNDLTNGKLRWGPANRETPPWVRNIQHRGLAWQNAGVGGTTLHYLANSPRAFPSAIDGIWPLSYRELIPYYEKVEATLPVQFAPTTTKEELFYYGAQKAGWPLIPTLDVTTSGYRPQPNAILPVNEHIKNPYVSLEQLSWMEGCTLCGHCVKGCPHGPSVDKVAKRSTDVSYVPLALKTGNVTIRPNAFVIKVLTEEDPAEGIRTTGVRIRDTWTGEIEELKAQCVVMAAGCVETPRLWLNSGLPTNPWVGRGLVNHYIDWVSGVFDEQDLQSILGTGDVHPFVGHSSGARLDDPGTGFIQVTGMSPGLMASLTYGFSESGYHFTNESDPHRKWDAKGRIVGEELKSLMGDYRRTLNLLLLANDQVDQRNGITVDPTIEDEHGPIPLIKYNPTALARRNRKRLLNISSNLLKKAGAKNVVWSDWPATLMIHMESTMRMGYVVDTDCEAYQVKRLYIADNSVHVNGIGGANPTLTTQALATRTAEKLANQYFRS